MQLLLKNARLRGKETLVDIAIDNGFIKEVAPKIDVAAETVIDANGKLVSPAFIDPHIHLDKVNIFDSCEKNAAGTLFGAIEMIWARKKNYTLEDILERSEDVVRMGIQNGTQTMRTHVDVDTIGGLMPIKGVLALKEKYKDAMDIQVIAFPQEGILKDPGCDKLMWEAMEMGATIVGGMPANENSPEDSLKHVKLCFDIAEKYDADIDMHVDETLDPFYRTLEMVADETVKRGWHGRVTAGHTCALGAYDNHYAAYLIEKCAKAGIHFITNPVTNLIVQGREWGQRLVPRGTTRVKELLKAGITVAFGQDCVNDAFYPFGNADMLEVANISAHTLAMSMPDEIEKVYDMLTVDGAKILRLENYGTDVGCRANLVVIDAEDIRSAIRLQPARLYVIRDGRIIATTEKKQSLYI